MTLTEIKAAVDAGQVVHWKHERYTVEWLQDHYEIVCDNGSTIGLTWADGIRMNGEEGDFYIALKDYRCELSIDVAADSPVNAAKQAWALLSEATMFPVVEVTDGEGEKTTVDLEEQEFGDDEAQR